MLPILVEARFIRAPAPRPAEIASIGQEQVEQLPVVAELRVTWAFRLDGQLAAGGQRAGLEAGADARFDPVEFGQ